MSYPLYPPTSHPEDCVGNRTSRTPTTPAPTPARPKYQFPVVKLRSWRTGYPRWLVLYDHHFVTVDPTLVAACTSGTSSTSGSTPSTTTTTTTAAAAAATTETTGWERKPTNAWSYSQLLEWMAVPNETDTILLSVATSADTNAAASTETLKFMIINTNNNNNNNNNSNNTIILRSVVLTALAHQHYLFHHNRSQQHQQHMTLSTSLIGGGGGASPLWVASAVSRECRRSNRTTTATATALTAGRVVQLHVHPFGVMEYTTPKDHDPTNTTNHRRTVFFIHIAALSFPTLATSPTTTATTTTATNTINSTPQTTTTTADIFLHLTTSLDELQWYRLESTTHRTRLVQLLQDQAVRLGHGPIPMAPSRHTTTLEDESYPLYQRPTTTTTTITRMTLEDATICSWPVYRVDTDCCDDDNTSTTTSTYDTTTTSTHDTTRATHAPLVLLRHLSLTRNGCLVELCSDNNIVWRQPIRDLAAILRPSGQGSTITLEFTGFQRHVTYTVSGGSGGSSVASTTVTRDAVIVTLLDAVAHHAGRGTHSVYVSDISLTGHCLAWRRPLPFLQNSERDDQGGGGSGSELSVSMATPTNSNSSLSNAVRSPSVASAAAALMTSSSSGTPASVFLLKRVAAVAGHVLALVSGYFGSTEQSRKHREEQYELNRRLAETRECAVLVTACHEFNATVVNVHVDLPPTTAVLDKIVTSLVHTLFALVFKLLAVVVASIPPPEDNTVTGNENESTPVVQVINAAIAPQTTIETSQLRNAKERAASVLLQTLYRLVQTRAGYKCAAEVETLSQCLSLFWTMDNVLAKYSALSVLNVLVSGTNRDRGQQAKRDLESEYVNKNVILNSGGPSLIQGLVSSLLPTEAAASTTTVSELILMVTSDILQNLLCSYRDTTSPEHFQALIAALAQRYRALLSTLRSSAPVVIENTSLLLQVLSTHSPATNVAIRDAALCSATILQHFYAATFSPLEGQRFLSRYLCSLWFSGSANCPEKRLLKRMVPHGFLAYLNMPALSAMEEEQLDEVDRDLVEGNTSSSTITNIIEADLRYKATLPSSGANTGRLRSRIALATRTGQSTLPKENFRIFFHVLHQDHALADLIWAPQTRHELRVALESELEYIRRETEIRGVDAIAWNHQQFSVHYASLDNEVRVGDIYMRLWLDAGDTFIRSWDEPVRLFEHLFRRFLCELDRNTTVTVMCIRCLERLYSIHASTIGPFTDVQILVQSMASTKNVETQHRLLGLLAAVLGVSTDGKDARYSVADIPENAEQLLNLDSIVLLCQFIAWGHTDDSHVTNYLSDALFAEMAEKGGPTARIKAEGEGPIASPVAVNCRGLAPPLWFIASTGKIPPPIESIRGPFRVSDLKRMMNSGDITPYDLVTSCHVDEYDVDENNSSESMQEAQVDTGKWKRLINTWQLRWQLCSDGASSAVYSPSDVAELALKALVRIVDLHHSLDSQGLPFLPIPTAKRILCGSNHEAKSGSGDSVVKPLPILCQSILSNNSKIVEQSSILIDKLCQHNEKAVSKLYLTGLYYFVLCYTGSDFKALSRLLYSTHLQQHFNFGFAAVANESELPMKDRSILGHMLPEGLLFVLTNYGPDRFAEVFVGNADTPEAIWTFDMRKHLVQMIQQHLGDFPLRLGDNHMLEYHYCPMPGVAYKRLEQELFCHNYYLRNLCDEARYPDWPIVEPASLFRACLERFKMQVNHDRSTDEEAIEHARIVLDLKAGDGSKELRKAYRSKARLYHPDKNPSGREMFEAIQRSYKILLPLLERGEKIRTRSLHGSSTEALEGAAGLINIETMHLLVKTQLLICRRYEQEMSQLKYPAYSVLLTCIKLPILSPDEDAVIDSLFAKSLQASLAHITVELIFRTCLLSPLNSHELVSEDGVPILSALFNFYVTLSIARQNSGEEKDNLLLSDDTLTGIITCTVQILSGVAFFERGREALKELPQLSSFLVNWRRCFDGSLSQEGHVLYTSMRRYSLEGISHFALDSRLQDEIIGAGVVWPLLNCALMFDDTSENLSIDNADQDDIGMSVASINVAARLSVRALGRLSGLFGTGPKNVLLAASLDSLLTRPISRMLRNKRTGVILQVLNSNVERSNIIWNLSMRQQLACFLSQQMKELPLVSCRTATEVLSKVASFEYDALKTEVRIGGVFVRCFNKYGKEGLSHVENPLHFLEAIVQFIARSLNQVGHSEHFVSISADDDASFDILDKSSGSWCASNAFLLAMTALRILCRVDSIVEDINMPNPDIIPQTLLSLLELNQDSESFSIGADILYVMCSKQSFTDAVAKRKCVWRLIRILERPEQDENTERPSDAPNTGRRKLIGWSVLESMSSSISVSSTILSTSVWLELLGVLVGHAKFTKMWGSRVGAAKVLSRLMWMGEEAGALLRRFLPSTLLFLLKDDPELMVQSFDSISDTPEYIWDASMRNDVRAVVGEQLERIVEARVSSGEESGEFVLEPQVCVRHPKLDDELYIGGVYVSRFLKEPTYNLRDPTFFLELLLQRWKKELEVSTMHRDFSSDLYGSTAVIKAGQDVLDQVITAIVYLCRTRDTLCDKLASWGYMHLCVGFLERVLEQGLFGTPLLAVVRLLHVASDRLANVEDLATTGDSTGRKGVIEHAIQAIGSENLHPDSAFIIEFLKKSYQIALGDLTKIQTGKYNHERYAQQSTLLAMAPSPAPGDAPTRRKVMIGDDPLGAMVPSPLPITSPQLQVTHTGVSTTQGAILYPRYSQGSSQAVHLQAHPHLAPTDYQRQISNPLYQVRQLQYQGQHNVPQQVQQQLAPNERATSQLESSRNVPDNKEYAAIAITGGTIANAAFGFHPGSNEATLPAPSQVPTFHTSQQFINEHQPTRWQQHLQQYPSRALDNPHGAAPFFQHHPSTSYQNSSSPHAPQVYSLPPQTQGLGISQMYETVVDTGAAHSMVMPSRDSFGRTEHQHQQLVPQPLATGLSPAHAEWSPGISPATSQSLFVPATPWNHVVAQSWSQSASPPPPQQQQQHQRPEQLPQTEQSTSTIIGPLGGAPAEWVAPPPTAAPPPPPVCVTDYRTLPYTNNGDEHFIDARSGIDPSVLADQQASAPTASGAPGAARGRRSLLDQALACGLCPFLVHHVLEPLSQKSNLTAAAAVAFTADDNEDAAATPTILPGVSQSKTPPTSATSSHDVRDPAAAMVHAVALLKLLCRDPSYGLKFTVLLRDMPEWQKYEEQDYSLLITTGKGQAIDYFLTNSDEGRRADDGVAKLLSLLDAPTTEG